MKIKKIALFGLGKLGLPLSIVFSQKIFTYGVDIDANKVSLLQNKKIPFYETNLQEYLNNSKENINFITINEFDINKVDAVIILVNTPSNETGEFSNKYIHDVIEAISIKLKKSNKKDFLFILSSTVMPNSHIEFISKIEKLSDKKLNHDFGFAYVPDLVALGSVIKDFENPDLLILGSSHEKYNNEIKNLYNKIIKNQCPIIEMSLIEAEITKISLNAYITMKISFANFIGNVCDILNCNSTKITKALGHDKRISPYYIKSGLAFGGTCFPRDTLAFIKMADNINLDASHIKAAQKINFNQNELLYKKLNKYKDKKIGILGIAFKPDTTVITESPGFILKEKLISEQFNVIWYDPLIQNEYNFHKFIQESEVIVITHNNKNLIKDIHFKNKIVIDPWNLIS